MGDRPLPEPFHDWRGLISDPGTPGEAIRQLASRADVDPEALAVLAEDQARLKATPAIAAAIYANPRASLSVANRAVACCHRAGVVPEGIPGFDELVLAIVADPAALDPGAVDSPFQQLMLGAPDDCAGESDSDAAAEGTLGVAAGTTDPPAAAGGPTPLGEKKKAGGRRPATIDFTRLKLYEKIRLATLGNAYCRQNLLRDANRMVAMAAIRSPQITDGEIAKAASNRSLSEDVIRYIANRKELVKQYAVRLALVGNAKCPLTVTLRLLPSLHADDIKQIARSKNVPGALSVAAKRLAATKGPQ